jgi:hypothetical protein
MAGGDGGFEVVSSGGGRGEIELQAFAYVTRVLHTVVERRGGASKALIACLTIITIRQTLVWRFLTVVQRVENARLAFAELL